MTTVNVDLGPRSYPIQVVSGGGEPFGDFVRRALDATWAGQGCGTALVITDSNVAPYLAHFTEALASAGITATSATVAPGEASKSLTVASSLLDQLVAMKADRHTAVVALGGGVIGDLAGFVAATYARGLPLVMVPTTLLADVDSSVGGKVGVNHPNAKNIIGAFHQPVAVWIDTDFFDTLPAREIRCGMAEVIKYGMILDEAFFDSLEVDADAILGGDRDHIREVIARCCRIKADVVSQDEREETGLRAVLNFGHTIGHAVESVSGYGGGYQHGEAIAVGMVAEARLAERMGWIGAEVSNRLERLLFRFGLPVASPGLDPGALRDVMGRDKKNRGGRVRFVLPRSIGRVEMTEAPEDLLQEAIATMVRAEPAGGVEK